jgi:preprotein translocase subunit SecG
MQFTKNTSKGRHKGVIKFLTKVVLVIFVFFLGVIILDKIEFPVPYKKIEKIIPNENFKTIK